MRSQSQCSTTVYGPFSDVSQATSAFVSKSKHNRISGFVCFFIPGMCKNNRNVTAVLNDTNCRSANAVFLLQIIQGLMLKRYN